MPKLSRTIFYTKNKDLAFEFWNKYKDRTDVERNLNQEPDKNNNYCVTITYLNK